MPHLEHGPLEYSFPTPKNESATPSSMDTMPPDTLSLDVKLTSRRVLQNRKQEKGIQSSHTSRPQKHAEQMMALDFIVNKAKIDDT
jgi:hypothetical protein